MEEKRQHHHNGLGSGFALGVVVGVIITLLFTTKKGREVVKELTDKGLEKFSDLEKRLQETEADFEDAEYLEDEDEDDDYVKPEPPVSSPPAEPVKEVHHVAPVKKETHENHTIVHKAASASEPVKKQEPVEEKKPEGEKGGEAVVHKVHPIEKAQSPEKVSPIRKFFRKKS